MTCFLDTNHNSEFKIPRAGLAQVAQDLPTTYEALGLIPSTEYQHLGLEFNFILGVRVNYRPARTKQDTH